jgi:hypothetical protein
VQVILRYDNLLEVALQLKDLYVYRGNGYGTPSSQ